MPLHPDGLLATNPPPPLSPGNPYFRGNVLQHTGINGLGIQNCYGGGLAPINLSNNSVWDDTDLTYVVRGTIVSSGYYDNIFTFGPGRGLILSNAPAPRPVAYGAERTPPAHTPPQPPSPGPGTPTRPATTRPDPSRYEARH